MIWLLFIIEFFYNFRCHHDEVLLLIYKWNREISIFIMTKDSSNGIVCL